MKVVLLVSCALFSTIPAYAHDVWGVGSERDVIPASDIATATENPNNDADTRYVLSRMLLWTPGSTIHGCFLNGSQGARTRVQSDMDSVTANPQHRVNLKVDFGNGQDCVKSGNGYPQDIRVSFADGCCSAFVGRTAHNPKAASGPSVFLEEGAPDYTIKHELLHALGFQHEHQKPKNPCRFDYKAIEQAYHWSESTVKNNFDQLSAAGSSKLAFSPGFDAQSIMKYYFDPSFLLNGTASPCYSSQATDLSDQDWVGLSVAYPGTFDANAFKKLVHAKRGVMDLGAVGSAAEIANVLKNIDEGQ